MSNRNVIRKVGEVEWIQKPVAWIKQTWERLYPHTKTGTSVFRNFIIHILQNKPVHPVSPSFVHPLAQSPHVRPPGVLEHTRALWHPPLLLRHSFTSASEAFRVNNITHNNEYKIHKCAPVQPVGPSFIHPDAHFPHMRPPGVLAHTRALWHPPLLLRHSFTSG